MAATESVEAIVLRVVRYGESDGVIALQTLELGRVSAFAKGIRAPKSRLRGRLQPGACARLELARGRGELAPIRGADIVDAHAGLWVEGYRLGAASSVLEAALRILPEEEPNPGAYHLLRRTLSLLASVPPRSTPARLDPIVLGAHAKLLVAAGILPQLGSCVSCARTDAVAAFSPRLGGVLCPDCRAFGEDLAADAYLSLVGLVSSPLAEAATVCPPEAGLGVERVIGLALREHLGVELRSATPL